MIVHVHTFAMFTLLIYILFISGGHAKVSEIVTTSEPTVNLLPTAPSSHESASFLHNPIAM